MRVFGFGALTVVLLLAVVTAQITHPNEASALKAIKKRLKDPVKNLRNWKKGDPCVSNWNGVVCYTMAVDTTGKKEGDDEDEHRPPNDGFRHIKELRLSKMTLMGSLSPQIGELPHLTTLNFMWNNISGSIPKEIGKLTFLNVLALNGNQLTGTLPEELGFFPDLYRLQIDENKISGPIPTTFANLNSTKHFHMNNNSISGPIPSELSNLSSLIHFLLDNNNLSGPLPPQLSELPELRILQLDNNNLDGTIPASYGNMKKLLKLSLRNCSLQGAVPDLSRLPLGYLDLSRNWLSGSMPSNKLSENMTTIDLSYNNLSGPFPANFSGLPRLQRLSLENNFFNGDIPSTIWLNRTFNETEPLELDFQNNSLSNISGSLPPANFSLRLEGNPVCEFANQLNIILFCGPYTEAPEVLPNSTNTTPPCSCPQYYEIVENAPGPCFCGLPLIVKYRLKSPGFIDFLPYESQFEDYIARGLLIHHYQISITSLVHTTARRLEMQLNIFPEASNVTNTFNDSELQRIMDIFREWTMPDDDRFGPYDLLGFVLLEGYKNEVPNFSESGISKGTVAGITLGAVAGAITLYAILSKPILRRLGVKQHAVSRKHQSRSSIKIDGVKGFTFEEMALATNNFNDSAEIGQGGYGKVYKGVLTDGTVVAVKRALEESLQGEKEFVTEIALLSRVHHRNLVSLIGFCDDKDEQMLVYEFMPNGTLRDYLSVKSEEAIGFAMRLGIALGSARGILYLHTEADPPIFHRDIKASNILLDSGFTAKVADFGLSKLAPVPDLKGTTPGHISTIVKGTPGYLDPEYFLTNKLTDKSDVYSLGVVFLELLTGMQPISHGKNIVREVSLAYNSGLIFSMIDEHMGSYPSEAVERFLALALGCCEDDPDARPSMAGVVRELEKIWSMIPDGEKTRPSDSVITKPTKGQSSDPATKNFYASLDISGSNLLSGVIPTVTPR